MIKKYSKIICIYIASIFLAGCWNYKDINKRTIGITVGIDLVDNDIEFTGERVKLWSGSSGGGTMNNKVTETYKFKAKGATFEAAKKNYELQIPEVDFPQSTISYIVSKKYAQKRGIVTYMNRTYFSPELRSSVHVTIYEESMDDLFNKKIENAISLGYGIENTLRYLQNEGRTKLKSVQEIQSDINFRNIGYLLPYVTVENNTIKYLGFAVMVNSKLVGTINQEDSNECILLLSKNVNYTKTVPNPSNKKNLLSIITDLKKKSIRTSYEDKKVNIYIDLNLKSVMQYEYHIEVLSNEDIKKVESIIESEAKEKILSAIKRSQNEFKSDIFGFARYFKAENPVVYRTINWKEEYAEAVFHVKVNTTIVSTQLLDTNAENTE